MAAALDLAVTGGSDFHGEGDHHEGTLGSVALPEDFAALQARVPSLTQHGPVALEPRSGE